MLRLEHITYRYSAGTPFEVKALDDVTLDIHRGRITGLIGHTGSGKSTLVQLLNGLTRPEAGRVLLDGQDIWQDPKQIGKVRFRVGLVMQYPEYQLFEETVRADIAFGPRNMQLSGEEIAERVDEAAGIQNAVGLDARRFPGTLAPASVRGGGGAAGKSVLRHMDNLLEATVGCVPTPMVCARGGI